MLPMLEAECTGWRSWDYALLEDGAEVAVISGKLLRGVGEVDIAGRPFTIGSIRGRFELVEDQRTVAAAVKPAALRRKFAVFLSGRHFTLEAASIRGRDFVLRRDGEEVGRITERGRFRRGLSAALPQGLPLETRVFVVWLTLLAWRNPTYLKTESTLTCAWKDILERSIEGYSTLDGAERSQLHALTKALVETKNWEGCGGLKLDEEMQVTLAGHAALMALAFPDYRFPNVISVLVYPGGFFAEDHRGGRILLGGEASEEGTVAVSWYEEDVISSAAIVVHEFAHLFDMLGGTADGLPPIADEELRAVWPKAFQREFERFVKDDEQEKVSILTSYAAKSRAEFFAMSSQCFFRRPVELRDERPTLYDLLRQWYRQDPALRVGSLPPVQEERQADREARIGELERLLRTTPDYLDGWVELARLQAAQGCWVSAEEALTAFLRLHPGDAQAHHERGFCRERQEKTAEALFDYGRAIDLEPDVADGYVARAELLFLSLDLEGALADVERALALDPADHETWIARGRYRLSGGDDNGAWEDCERALDLAPKAPTATRLLAELYSKRGEHTLALQHVEEAIESFRASGEAVPADCHVLRGHSLLRLGEHRRALETAEKALEADPECADALRIRAEVHLELGDLDASLTDCDEAVRRSAQYANAYLLRARVLRAVGRLELANEDERRAQELPSLWC